MPENSAVGVKGPEPIELRVKGTQTPAAYVCAYCNTLWEPPATHPTCLARLEAKVDALSTALLEIGKGLIARGSL